MTDPVSAARAARQNLAQGLAALQTPGLPPQLTGAAEPIAQAMGALHRIESSHGAALGEAAPAALEGLRRALQALQSIAITHPAHNVATEAVASTLGQVHGLTQMAPPQGVSAFAGTVMAEQAPPAPHGQGYPPPAQQYAQPGAQQYAPPGQQYAQPGAQQYAQAPAAYPQQPPQQHYPQAAPPAQPQYPQQQHHQPPQYAAAGGVHHAAPAAAMAPQPAAPQQPRAAQHAAPPQHAPAPQQAAGYGRAPASAPGQQVQPESRPSDGRLRVEAELGAHSATNFYKGLSGNDIIDSGGIFVATYQIPPVGSDVVIKVSMPGGYEFEALGVVAWTRDAPNSGADSSPGFGARFTHISPEGRQLVYRYVRNREPLFHDDL